MSLEELKNRSRSELILEIKNISFELDDILCHGGNMERLRRLERRIGIFSEAV